MTKWDFRLQCRKLHMNTDTLVKLRDRGGTGEVKEGGQMGCEVGGVRWVVCGVRYVV